MAERGGQNRQETSGIEVLFPYGGVGEELCGIPAAVQRGRPDLDGHDLRTATGGLGSLLQAIPCRSLAIKGSSMMCEDPKGQATRQSSSECLNYCGQGGPGESV